MLLVPFGLLLIERSLPGNSVAETRF